MASRSEADAGREPLQGAEERVAEVIEQEPEHRDVAGVEGTISDSGENTERNEVLVNLNQQYTKKKRTPAAAAILSQGLMKAIRSKPLWQEKLGDETIVNKYKKEAIEQGLSTEIVEKTIKHLQLKARQYLTSKASTSALTSDTPGPACPMQRRKAISQAEMQDLIDTLPALQARIPCILQEPLEEEGCGVWYVDNIVPGVLRDLLETSLDAIAELPEKDFHPESNKQVQDLIHPSLFPYIDGVSPLLVDESTLPPKPSRFLNWSRPYADSKYQWLPSQFYVDANGSVQIRTYVNNLERNCNRELYKAIELIFGIFLPMFERLLSPQQRLRERELQVIVKAANYVIQPKGTVYEGTWHVEGMTHEQIVASGIYYYSTSPWLEDDGLEFRRERDEDKDWPQMMSYNISDYIVDSDEDDNEENQEKRKMLSKLTQNFQKNIYLGAVPTLQERLLVFSNELQHKVSKVVNNSDQVGTRKILVFFLVDPDTEIVSTKHVPEQQWERNYPRLSSVMREVSVKVTGKRLPLEIEQEILTRASRGQGMTMAEAKRHRLVLMRQRARKDRDDNDDWESEYALCEH